MTSRKDFHDQHAATRERESGRHYHTLLEGLYRFFVPPNVRVLELGSGVGNLLAAVRPKTGVGVDFSAPMTEIASRRHGDLKFETCDVDSFTTDEKFDYVIASDLVNDLPDVQATLARARELAHP